MAIGKFALHFLEMCVVMCAGGIALDSAVFGALGAFGYADIVSQAPELAMIIVAFEFAIVMAAYLLLRRHPAQHNAEMSGSTVLGAIPFVAALWLGWIPRGSLAQWREVFVLMCTPLCVLMFLVMLARFDHYGGRVGAVFATDAEGDFTVPRS